MGDSQRPNQGSISKRISGLRRGDSAATRVVWQRYIERLVVLARRQLGRAGRTVADEEDVVVDAFQSFFRGMRANRFAKMETRDDLWQVLAMLVSRKAVNQRRFLRRKKRGGVADNFAGGRASNSGMGKSWRFADTKASPAPGPEEIAMFREELQHRMEQLDDPLLRKVALLKMEGYSNEEIAAEIDRHERSVERKLNLIRRIWLET